MKLLRNKSLQKGQALIEFLVTSMGCIFIVALIISAACLTLSHFFIKYQLQSALICLSNQSALQCEGQLKKNLKHFLLFGRVLDLRLESKPKIFLASVHFEWTHSWGLHFDKNYKTQMQK